MVTHDRYLIRELASCIWAIEDRELKEFGGIQDYRDWKAQRGQERARRRIRDQEEGATPSARIRAREQRKAARREEERRALRQSELEERIHELEARQSELEVELAAASQEGPAAWAVARVRELGLEYTRIEQELDELLAAWAEVA
jgi:ATPase subunit of ABC transporter with duplicated ATPase domains